MRRQLTELMEQLDQNGWRMASLEYSSLNWIFFLTRHQRDKSPTQVRDAVIRLTKVDTADGKAKMTS